MDDGDDAYERALEPHSAEGQVRFEVIQALKGIAGPQVTVLNAAGYNCGYQSRPDFHGDYEPEATRRITIADDRGCGYAPFDSGPVKQ